jgi:hypothetical protein
MLTKRNDGDLPVPFETGEGLAEEHVTRARALKLLGAMGATGAFALFTGGTAEAGERDRRRRRRRRRRRIRQRRNNITTNTDNSTIDFGDNLVDANLPVTRTVEVTNNGDVPVTVRPVVGDGFTLLDADGNEIANGDTIRIPANDTVELDVVLTELVDSGTLKLVDVRDGVVLETVDLVADLL